MTCKSVGRNQPRVLTDRHQDDCPQVDCPGCEPCLEAHCRVCGRGHAEHTCPGCLAAARTDLAEIGRLCDAEPGDGRRLLEEAASSRQGVDSEAMVLLGPTADPEALGHMEASVAVGRVPADYLEKADDVQHPLWVLGNWEMVWRDHIDAPTELTATLPRLLDFLSEQLHLMGAEPLFEMDQFMRELRACRMHLEAVLHDGEQRDTGAPCMECHIPLVRVWGDLAADDGWRCPRCRTFSTEDQYRLAVRANHLESAEWLPAAECIETLGLNVGGGTIAVWATRGIVRRKRESGRTLYAVSDVAQHAQQEDVA